MWQNYSRGQGFLGLKAALVTVAMRCSQAQYPVSWRLEQERKVQECVNQRRKLVERQRKGGV